MRVPSTLLFILDGCRKSGVTPDGACSAGLLRICSRVGRTLAESGLMVAFDPRLDSGNVVSASGREQDCLSSEMCLLSEGDVEPLINVISSDVG
jgi:hypothetical protein